MSSLLPEGWTKQYSRSQQREYYFHAATNKSVWSLDEIFSNFRETISKQLEGLKHDKDEIKFEFPPYSSEKRAIIHEIAQDLGELVTITLEGGDDERSVVAYKFGHAPEEETVTVLITSGKKKKRKSEAPPKASEEVELETIGLKKRDRRTIEEIEMEKRKAKELR